jgi:hypothetical protein
MEVGLFLLELAEAFLTLFELVAHFNLNRARLIYLGRLLVQFFLNDLKFFLARFECLQLLLEIVVILLPDFLHLVPPQPAA